ncbi:MANSC domain-containing protein 1 [Erythrolamprus reginae]|uniref:MANSC domain-containing protein 1 n=1 Tax=Erythrolamprus reginae TaxID=121349 RepID=UPI00396CBBEA
MAVQTARCLAWLSAVLVLVLVKPSHTQKCSSEKMEDITIDISAAFSKGLRGTDPIYAPSWEACVETCCSERIEGDKACSYVIFNTRVKSTYPNCYQFYLPAQETCPVKPAAGLVTYRITEGKQIPKPAPFLNIPHSTVNGTASPQAAGFGLARTLGGPDTLPETSKKGEIFASSEPPLEKASGFSKHPKAGRTKGVEILVHESNSTASAAQRSTPVKLSLATLDSSTSRTVGAVTIHHSSSHATTSVSFTRKTEGATLQPSKTPLPKSSFPSKTDPHRFGPPSSALPSPSAPLRDGSGPSDGRLSFEARNAFSLLNHQSVLFAALFFEVLFFVLAVVLIARKVFHSRQHQRYTRLDYLINDMYANM